MPALGASGAIAGLIGALGMYFIENRQVVLGHESLLLPVYFYFSLIPLILSFSKGCYGGSWPARPSICSKNGHAKCSNGRINGEY